MSARLPAVVWPLLFGNFVIGTGVMALPGSLNEISASLDVSVPTAGQLIAAGALMMFIAAPLFAAVVAGWDRRRLLMLSMLWYGVFHLACALAPNYAWLLPLRVLAVIPPAVFTPQAAACMGLLVPLHQRGRAITFIFVGWSVASALGMPLAAFVSGHLGWRTTFAGVGALSLFSAAWVWRALPDGVKPPALSRADWGRTLGSAPIVLTALVTVLYGLGQFVVLAYMAPIFKLTLGSTPTGLSLLFAVFGVAGFVGNVLVSRHIDRLGPSRAVMLTIAGMALTLALWPLGVNPWLMALVLIPWGMGCFASNSAQQARLVTIAPALASGSIALNTSGIYAGQGLGAALGGWMVAHGRMDGLHWAGLAAMLAAMVLSAWVTHLSPRAHSAAQPA